MASPRDFGIVITGDREVNETLRFLEVRLQRQLVRKATGVAARKIVLRTAERLAPKDTGRLASSLKVRDLLPDSIIKSGSKSAAPQRASGRAIGSEVYTDTEGIASEDGNYYYGAAVELGLSNSRNYPQQEFLRPALYDKAKSVKVVFIRALKDFIRNVGK